MESITSLLANLLSLFLLAGAVVWVYLDAKAIGDDRGQMPGLVNTKPAAWATGTFLMLIVALPAYLITRVSYKRQAAARKAQRVLLAQQSSEGSAEAAGIWPPPPNRPRE